MKTLNSNEVQAIAKTYFGLSHGQTTCVNAIEDVQKQLRKMNSVQEAQPAPVAPCPHRFSVFGDQQPRRRCIDCNELETAPVAMALRVFFEQLGHEKRVEFVAMINRALNTWDTGPKWLFDLCGQLEQLQAELNTLQPVRDHVSFEVDGIASDGNVVDVKTSWSIPFNFETQLQIAEIKSIHKPIGSEALFGLSKNFQLQGESIKRREE